METFGFFSNPHIIFPFSFFGKEREDQILGLCSFFRFYAQRYLLLKKCFREMENKGRLLVRKARERKKRTLRKEEI